MSFSLDFQQGELHISQLPEFLCSSKWEKSKFTKKYKSQPWEYRSIVEEFIENTSLDTLEDNAKAYQKINLKIKKNITPRLHQKKALEKWLNQKMQGVVNLPTGAGKTILATFAMEKICRSTLVVVPTIDLVLQWKKTLEEMFGIEVGQLGGGENQIRPVTVSTL